MRRISALILATAMLLGACTGSEGGRGDVWSRGSASTIRALDDTGSNLETRQRPVDGVQVGLRLGDSCESLLSWVQDEVSARVDAYGLDSDIRALSMEVTVDAAAGEDGTALSVPQAAEGQPDRLMAEESEHSTTNVQEAGVDEADIVKTDGTFIYAVAGGTLHVIDANPDDPVVVDRFPIGGDGYSAAEILIGHDRLYAVSTAVTPDRWLDTPRSAPARPADGVEDPADVDLDVTDVDVTVPPEPVPDTGLTGGITVVQELLISPSGELSVGNKLSVEGWYVTARQVGDTVRLVVRTDATPRLGFVTPSGEISQDAATDQNRSVVRASTLGDWLPSFELEQSGEETDTGVLTPCDRVALPVAYSGTSSVSVLTFGMSDPLDDGNPVTIFGTADAVYASTTSLYTSSMTMPTISDDAETVGGLDTQIHQFDISDPTATSYVASGSVQGVLLNQWAMSEHDGHLRVATTEGLWGMRNAEQSSSSVVVLRRDGDELVQTGIVEGLGPDERVVGVRFMGAMGYVVTFRLTDPLYAIDLTDPANPHVLGELKITGYSSYLHPVGEDLLLGVGSEATEDGMILGAKVSLFDVSDPTDPQEIDRLIFPESSSSVEWDHRSFLHWPAANLAVVPMWEGMLGGDMAVGLSIEGNRISERGRIDGAVARSLVIGDTLWTVGYDTVRSHDLGSLALRSEVPLTN